MIAFASPLAQYKAHKSAVDAAIRSTLESGTYILGNQVAVFERDFAKYCGCQNVIGVASGTDALMLAILALDLPPGSEVVTVSHTAVATVAAVLAARAVPVLVDVDPIYRTLDSGTLEQALSPKTKAIIAVHLYGQPADLDPISAFADKNGLALIEDCAQSAGGSYKGRRLGSIGTIGCFSFFPTKNLGAIGDGGAVVTSDTGIARAVARLRQYGWDSDRVTQGVGINSRLDEIQAAILTAKLPSLDDDNARRAELARRYTIGLAGLPVKPPVMRHDCAHAFHLYVVDCPDRDALAARLAKADIGTGIHYPTPVHRQKGYAERVRVAGGMVATDALAKSVLSLPIFPELSYSDVDRTIDAIRGFFGKS